MGIATLFNPLNPTIFNSRLPLTLSDLGWNDDLAAAFEARAGEFVRPGRVAVEFNQIFRVYLDGAEIDAITAGRLKHRAEGRADLPAVGDWVAVRQRPGEDRGVIVAVLSRRSAFKRRATGAATEAQIVAANVDVVFVVMGLDADYNLRRLERYLAMARESSAAPVVLLTKPDLCADVPSAVAAVVGLAGGLPVHVVRAPLGQGLDEVRAHLGRGRTGALLGSSGVGKSTILNRLAGSAVQRTRGVRVSDARGRHTTTHRALVILPGLGLVIDTPGMRELHLWEAAEGVGDTFDEIRALAGSCHFSDCRHRDEPRCAVKAAVAAGQVSRERLDSHLKLQDELARLSKDQDERGWSTTKPRTRRS